MGKYWLHDCIGTIQKYGVKLDFYPGYETRSRKDGGFTGIWGIGTHHDACSINKTTEWRQSYAWQTADSRPIGNFYLKKNGGVTFGCAGASNTQGTSETSFHVSKGTIPVSKGNEYLISIEAENDGIGEMWQPQMLESYLNLCAALCEQYSLDPITDIFSHHRYTNRKIDPAGPTPGFPYGNSSWPDNLFNADVLKRIGTQMQAITPRRLFEGRVESQVETFIPCSESGTVFVNITVADTNEAGWVSSGADTNTHSIVNFTQGLANSCCVPVGSLGGFYLTATGPCRLIVDLFGVG